VVGVLARAFSAGTARNERLNQALADVLIRVDTNKFSTGDYTKAPDLIAAGYEAAENNRAVLKKFALDDAGWAAHIADRRGRERPKPGILRTVKIEGGGSGAQAEARTSMKSLEGKPIDSAALSGAVRGVEGNGTYQGNFETFSPDTPGPSGKTMAVGPDTGVLVRLNKVRNGPPFLLFGADLTAATSNVTRGSLDFRLVDQDLGGFGSEFRADLRVGFLTQASAEYYRLLSRSGYYLQPQIGMIREPVYLWQNQKRVSERLSQQSGGGLDMGRTFSRHLQASVEWRAQLLQWHLVNGSDGTQDISENAQTVVAHVVYDSAESAAVLPRGSRLEISAGSLFGAAAGRNAPLVRIKAARAFAVAGRGIVAVSAEGNTFFRRNVAEPLRFTVGGPLRLSASSIDEYRGTDSFLVRAAYLHRIASLPAGLGEGVFMTFGYEAGEIWTPERSAILRQDGLLTVIAATPLGAITFGGAVGDAGRRKLFFSFGRLF
jgi:NTE family protein